MDSNETIRYHGVRWVWFDIDDTIFDFSKNSRLALTEVYNATELLQRLYDSPEVWAEIYESYNKPLWEMYNRGDVTVDFLRVERFAAPLADAGVDRDEADAFARRLDPLYLDILSHLPSAVEGAVELIRHIHDRGYKIGVLSNGFHGTQEQKLVTVGVDRYIDEIVLSEDVGCNKPHKPIYEYAMRRADDMTPSHHLMIGDNPTTDISGALAVGWHAIHLDPRRHNAGIFVHNLLRVDSLIDLLPLF